MKTETVATRRYEEVQVETPVRKPLAAGRESRIFLKQNNTLQNCIGVRFKTKTRDLLPEIHGKLADGGVPSEERVPTRLEVNRV